MSTAAPEHGEKIIDPIHQFVINRIVPLDIGGVDISFTNSALWAVIAVTCASLLVHSGAAQFDPNPFAVGCRKHL